MICMKGMRASARTEEGCRTPSVSSRGGHLATAVSPLPRALFIFQQASLTALSTLLALRSVRPRAAHLATFQLPSPHLHPPPSHHPALLTLHNYPPRCQFFPPAHRIALSRLVNMAFDLKLVFGMIGNATATALFLSPLPTFIRIFRKGSTEEYSGLPYVCTLFNCMLWVLYGMPFIKPHSVLILTINGFGVALELFYIMVFLAYAMKEKKMQMMKWIIAIVVAYSVVILVVLFGLHSLSTRQLAAGTTCVVVAIAMYAAPLSVMGLVIRTRSVEYMPFFLSLFNFLNGAVWSGYSLVTRDIFIAIPNGLGTLSGIAQLVLYAVYKNAIPINAEEKLEKIPTTQMATPGSRNPQQKGRPGFNGDTV